MTVGTAVSGWGAAVPSGSLGNAELAARLNISEDWIEARTGVLSRHIAAPGETASTLAVEAGRAALDRAGVEAGELDVVIVATATPDFQIPATAPLVQHGLGATSAAAFDVGAGCSGFLYALAQADALVRAGSATKVLVCGAEVLSRVTDYDDARSCVLFGDGAGAALVEARAGGTNLGPFLLRSDGSRPELLYVPPDDGFLRMQGREVYRRAVEAMTGAATEVLGRAGLSIEDVDLLVAHQANGRIVEAVAQRVGIDPARVVLNIDRYGNTSAASIPIALCEAWEDGRLHDGDRVLISAFGAGFVWGAGMLIWGSGIAKEKQRREVAHA